MLNILLFSLAAYFPSDSLRMEVINGKQFVVHQVGEKETLFSISRRYGATIVSILEQNPTADAGLEVGQILKVPYSPKTRTTPPIQTSSGVVHKVAAKETLFSIARQYNVSVDDIKTWNSLTDNSLSLGQDILIKKKSDATPLVTPTVTPTETKTIQPAGSKTHTVAAKETLFSISRMYGMSVQQLKEWNALQSDELRLGQILSVSATPIIANTTTTTAAVTTVMKTPTVIPTTNPVTVSENIAGTDEIRETGFAELIEGSEGNRKYLAQHRTIKPGTILKVRNILTNQEVFVRVTSPLPTNDLSTIIRISKSAYDRLGATDPKFQAEITYYK